METLKQFRLLVGNIPMVSVDGREEIEYGMGTGRRVVVRHPIRSLRAWKLFLYCLWQVEEVEEEHGWYRLRVPLWVIRAVLHKPNMSILDIARMLEEVRDVEYLVYEEDGDRGEEKLLGFRLFPSIEIVVERSGEGNMYMYLDKRFYEYCLQEGLLFYVPFMKMIQSPTAMNLFMWLSTRQDEVFREEVLIERSGLCFKDYPDYKKRQELKEGLHLLVRIGFIRGYARLNDGRYYIHRYSPEELKAKAKELAKDFQIEDEEYIQTHTEKERQRKQKARAKKHTT